ncbi:hypothetical protein B0H34DRAFT_674223 [Crassisporium funariophilum]|nr:hypothetical protein B0H34DRAFT_674223 [Crassisporium funariophilum]
MNKFFVIAFFLGALVTQITASPYLQEARDEPCNKDLDPKAQVTDAVTALPATSLIGIRGPQLVEERQNFGVLSGWDCDASKMHRAYKHGGIGSFIPSLLGLLLNNNGEASYLFPPPTFQLRFAAGLKVVNDIQAQDQAFSVEIIPGFKCCRSWPLGACKIR